MLASFPSKCRFRKGFVEKINDQGIGISNSNKVWIVPMLKRHIFWYSVNVDICQQEQKGSLYHP